MASLQWIALMKNGSLLPSLGTYAAFCVVVAVVALLPAATRMGLISRYPVDLMLPIAFSGLAAILYPSSRWWAKVGMFIGFVPLFALSGFLIYIAVSGDGP